MSSSSSPIELIDPVRWNVGFIRPGIALSRQRVYPLAFTSTTLLPMDPVIFFVGRTRLEAFKGGVWFLLLSFNLVKVHVYFFVLLWTPLHGRAKARLPARTCIQQLCVDTGCNLEDRPEAMNDREGWGERVRDIRADGTTRWWRWWYSREWKDFILKF